MANIQIWNGSSQFAAGQTPFGFYDADAEFIAEADKVAKYCAIKLGWPLMDVELTSGSFYAAFEEAVTQYGNELYQQQIQQNFLSVQGGNSSVNLNATLVRPSLNRMIEISKNYGTEAGVGGTVRKYSGSLDTVADQQTYDLNLWASQQGITGGIEIRKVFYEAPPAILRYFDPYAGTGTGIQSLMDAFDFGSYSPGVNFLLMPTSFDMLKVQAIEFNDQVRRSQYSFELVGNQLKLFPIPKNGGKLFFEFYKNSDKRYIDDGVMLGGGSAGSNYGGTTNTNNVITNISNVPYANPVYSDFNAPSKAWVYNYAAAVSKEMLAYIRGKYTSIPVPGSEATLNQADLLADARTEKTGLIESLRANLASTNMTSLLEAKASEAKFLNDTLQGVPMLIYVG